MLDCDLQQRFVAVVPVSRRYSNAQKL
jgi:hypothetical protein